MNSLQKTLPPYLLIIDGKLQGYYNSLAAAMYTLSNFDPELPRPSIKIYREDGNSQELVHEE